MNKDSKATQAEKAIKDLGTIDGVHVEIVEHGAIRIEKGGNVIVNTADKLFDLAWQASRQSLEGQEPVAEVKPFVRKRASSKFPDYIENMTKGLTKRMDSEDMLGLTVEGYRATPPSAIEIRNGALEEAAKICDKSAADFKESRTVHEAWCGYADTGCMVCASLIRDIIKPSETPTL